MAANYGEMSEHIKGDWDMLHAGADWKCSSATLVRYHDSVKPLSTSSGLQQGCWSCKKAI